MHHSRFRRLALALALALAACGGGTKPAETTPATAEVQAEVVLELGEITLIEGNDAIAKIHADGKTEFGEAGRWQPGPTMKADGTIEHEGTAVAKVNADGTITDLKSTEKLPFTISTDKLTITAGDKSMDIALDAAGVVTVTGEDGPKNPVRVEGAKTPGQRKTALAFLALMVGARQPEPAPAPTGGATPPAGPPG